MSKLIRLVGDSTKNNKEIRNVFSKHIRISANSTISLRNVNADLLVSNEQEQYPIGTGTQYTYKTDNPNATEILVDVPASDYDSPSSLFDAMNIAANSAGTANHYDTVNNKLVSYSSGLHNRWHMDNNKTNLAVYKSIAAAPGFEDDFEWADISGLTRTSDSIQTTGAGTMQYDGFLPYIIPLVSNVFQVTIPSGPGGEFQIKAVSYDDSDYALWGVFYNTGTYKLYALGQAVLDSGYAGAAGDIVQLFKYGDEVRLLITNAGIRVNETLTLTELGLEEQSAWWYISINDTFALNFTKAKCHFIEALEPGLGQTQPVYIDLNLVPDSADETRSLTLQKYLGFTESVNKFVGDPALLTSSHDIKGIRSNAGTLVTIAGIDLHSYSGTIDQVAGGINILDVIPLGSNPTNLDYQPSYPLRLKMRNTRDMVISDLTVAFQRNQINPTPFSFIGFPVVVLEIQSPLEDR